MNSNFPLTKDNFNKGFLLSGHLIAGVTDLQAPPLFMDDEQQSDQQAEHKDADHGCCGSCGDHAQPKWEPRPGFAAFVVETHTGEATAYSEHPDLDGALSQLQTLKGTWSFEAVGCGNGQCGHSHGDDHEHDGHGQGHGDHGDHIYEDQMVGSGGGCGAGGCGCC
jgi:hypothetical protein